tara:strand:+ start:15368 stop:15712 length:345 start_codon:yes stop_codon:yes gene_type:complete
MPHIIVEYSRNLSEIIEISDLVIKLHDTLSAAGIDKERIKTRAIACSYVAVGDYERHGHMLHATLLLLEGRDTETKQKYGEGLHAAMKSMVEGVVRNCAVTLEIRDMDKDTYYM